MRKPTSWVPTRSDTNRAVQSQKMVRGWNFWFYEEEESFYPCSENNGTDQLRGYREADLRLCFRICRLFVFPCARSFNNYLRTMDINSINRMFSFQREKCNIIEICDTF